MAIVLQRGSIEGRFYAMELLQQISKKGYDYNSLTKHHAIDLFKSILELASDEIIKKASTVKMTDSSIATQWYDIVQARNYFSWTFLTKSFIFFLVDTERYSHLPSNF